MKAILASALVVAGLMGSGAPGAFAAETMQTKHEFTFKKAVTQRLDYLLFLPKGYEKAGEKRWPLILFLHGAGERGSDVLKVAVHGPPKYVNAHPEFPFVVVSPQCPDGRVWSDDVLLGLLDEILRTHAIDPGRVYLTGLSMGGYGTWSLGTSSPEKFAAIAPICGGGNIIGVLLAPPEKGPALRTLKVWAFHGAKDPVVPLEESERMIAALKRVGVKDVKLTAYPEAQHDSWTETYNNPELYRWFLEHERKPASAQ